MPLPHERNLGPFKISESYWRLMQTDPFDDKTLLDGTGSLVSYLAISGTVDAFEFIGDGNKLTNLNLDSYGLISSSNQVVELLQGAVVNVETIIAQQYIVSSSVTYITQSYSSGSTAFGDSVDDTHAFTGSMFVTGPITANSFSGIFNGVISSSQQISNLGFITSSGEASAVEWGNILNIPNNIVSGSGQRDVLGLSETDDVTFANIFGTNASFDGNVLVTGTITARTFVISSSVINQNVLNVSGSSFFGNSFDDTHTFTGSVLISGSFYVPSAISLDPSSEYGSLAINGGDLFIYM
jgi:hypothetical protein